MAQILYPNELQSSELALEFLEYAPHRFLNVPTYHFRMVETQTGAYAGRINLRVSHTDAIELYAGHIGYEVHPRFRGRRYAAQAVRMLLPLAYRLALDPLWITCDPDNLASRRTCELAGGVLYEVVTVPQDNLLYAYGSREKCRYQFRLLAPEAL